MIKATAAPYADFNAINAAFGNKPDRVFYNFTNAGGGTYRLAVTSIYRDLVISLAAINTTSGAETTLLTDYPNAIALASETFSFTV